MTPEERAKLLRARIPNDDMQHAIKLAGMIRDTRRRPRSRQAIAYALCFYAAALCDGDAEAIEFLVPRLLAIAEDLKEQNADAVR